MFFLQIVLVVLNSIMRTLLFLSVLACAVSAFSLLREFDDERLLPHFRVRRAAAEESSEVVAVASGAELTDEEKILVVSARREDLVE